MSGPASAGSPNCAPERCERKRRKFEMLPCEWQANDGDGAENAHDEVGGDNGKASEENSEHVHENREASARRRVVGDSAPERQESEGGDFEALQAKRNPDNCEAENACHILNHCQNRGKHLLEPGCLT